MTAENTSFADVVHDVINDIKLGKFTVLIAGKTGVGKSTIINEVFRGNIASTGSGRPVTDKINEYRKDGIPISIIDTIGFELADYKKIIDELSEYIDSRLSSDNADDHIHVAWICINTSSDRIENAEIDLLKKIRRYNIPVIVVLTKTINSKSPFIEEARKILYEANAVIPIRALSEDIDGLELKPMGIDKLISETYGLLPDAKKRAYTNALSNKHKKALDLRKKQASIEVNIASGLAGAAGATPIPFSQAFVLVPIQVGMLAKISQTFGMEVSATMLSTLVTSLVGASSATLIGRTVVSGLLKFIPGGGSVIGGAIAAATAISLTKLLGNTYVDVLYDYSERNPGSEFSIEAIVNDLKERLKF
jgi:uncharacterized protein (DUF697 family)/GTP-binding protein EngB required for normal cell division